MGVFETLNRLGILSVGRRPEWAVIENPSGPPSSLLAGRSISDAVKTLIHIALREEAHRRTARVTLGFVEGTQYRVTINGTNFDVTGGVGSDDDAVLVDIADAIEADAVISEVVTATVAGDIGSAVLTIRGVSEGDYDIAVSIVSGTGTIELTADATTCNARIWLLADGTGDRPGAWVQANDAVFEGIDYRGLTERVSTAGFRRVYVQVEEADGEVSVAVGPGVME